MLTQAPKGTVDMLPKDAHRWQSIQENMRRICALAGYREIRTPIFEHTELFQRGVGDTTDVVQKEMYTFNDKGNRSITLKPEGTAGAARALIEAHLYAETLPVKMYYSECPCFRYEKPQAGRLRQFHQNGVEVFGAKEVKKGEGKKTKAQCYEEMRGAAQAEFDKGCDLPTVTLKVDFINCADTEEYRQYGFLQNIFLGDAVRVLVKKLGISVSMRMTQYAYDCLTRRYTSVTLGTVADTLEGNTISPRQLPAGIQQISLSITCSGAGSGSSGKVLIFHKANYQSLNTGVRGSAQVGATMGTLTGKFYSNTVTHTLNASSNAALFAAMKAYFEAGNSVLVLYNGETSSSSG